LKFYFEKSITFCLIIYQVPQQPQLEAKSLWSELLLTSPSMKTLLSSSKKTFTSLSMKTLTSSRMKTLTSSIAAVVKDEGSSLHLHFKTLLESQTNKNGFGQTPLFKIKGQKKSLKMFNFLSKFLHFLNYNSDLRFFLNFFMTKSQSFSLTLYDLP
jgi:hypothetical protein